MKKHLIIQIEGNIHFRPITEQIRQMLSEKGCQTKIITGKTLDRAAILDEARKLQSSPHYDTALIVEK